MSIKNYNLSSIIFEFFLDLGNRDQAREFYEAVKSARLKILRKVGLVVCCRLGRTG